MIFAPIGFAYFFIVTLLLPLITLADYDGEVLVANPPPNWAPEPTFQHPKIKTGRWVRRFPKHRNWKEEVIFRYIPNRENDDPQLWAKKLAQQLETNCETVERKETGNINSTDYSHAFVQVLCLNKETVSNKNNSKAWNTIFTTVKIISGNFNRYEISRRWHGSYDSPQSPYNSPKILARWALFFDSIRVCNTLFESCDGHITSTFSNAKFKNMRVLKETKQSVHNYDDLVIGLKKLGHLTGNAESCGEDTSSLLSKINRMIDSVTENEKLSTDASAIFHSNHRESRAIQVENNAEDCGEARRRFRGHPTRIKAFHKFISGFF